MLCFKKSYRDELLQLALVLSILRLNEDSFYENDLFNTVNLDYNNGTIWQTITQPSLRSHYVNPKSLDSVLINYERELFADLNSLGRFARTNYRYPNVTTYLLNIERNAPATDQDSLPVPNQPQNQSPEALNNSETPGNSIDGLSLTQEVSFKFSKECYFEFLNKSLLWSDYNFRLAVDCIFPLIYIFSYYNIKYDVSCELYSVFSSP